jgi:glycosyltransferase involved in cell wall biosynthesis
MSGGSQRISVIVPVRDGERYLAEALESILRQSAPPFEVIVVDDGSTDATPTVAARYGPVVRYARQPPAGVSAAVNLGLKLALGEYLAFLDADDLWVTGKLALQLQALQQSPRIDLVFGHVTEFWSPELDGSIRNGLREPSADLPGYCRGTMLVSRRAFSRVGPFDTRWTVGEFVDWYARAAEAGLAAHMLPTVLLHRRLHAANSSRRATEARMDYVRIARAVLERRRDRP